MQISGILGFAGLSLVLMSVPAWAEEAQPEQLIDGLNGVFGAHAKMRAAHTKGICVKGNFTPTAEAAALSKVAGVCRAGSSGRALLARRRQPDGLRRPEGQCARHRHALPAARRRRQRPVADLGADLRRQDARAVPRAAARPLPRKTRTRSTPSSRPIPDSTRQRAWLTARADAGELRNRRLFRRAHFHSDQRQGRSPADQVEGGAGRRLRRPQ